MGERRRKFNDKEVFTKLDTTRVYPSRVPPQAQKKRWTFTTHLHLRVLLISGNTTGLDLLESKK